MDERSVLVLCEEIDLDALWAWRELSALAGARLNLVTSGMLANALSWSHTISNNGASVEIGLADGRKIRSDAVAGVLNRLINAPHRLTPASDAEAQYAQQEWNAFFVSWLHALPGPMLNRPKPAGLCGLHRGIGEWTSLAVQAGLPVKRCHLPETAPAVPQGDAGRAWVVGDAVLGCASTDPQMAGRCRMLAERASCGLLGIDFERDSTGTWQFTGATPFPLLREGGTPLLRALAAALHLPV